MWLHHMAAVHRHGQVRRKMRRMKRRRRGARDHQHGGQVESGGGLARRLEHEADSCGRCDDGRWQGEAGRRSLGCCGVAFACPAPVDCDVAHAVMQRQTGWPKSRTSSRRRRRRAASASETEK
jgi:hypothetical protein